MPASDRLKLEAIERIERSFLAGATAAELKIDIAAAAAELTGARAAELVENDDARTAAFRSGAAAGSGAPVRVELRGRSGPVGVLLLDGVRATAEEVRRDLGAFLDTAAILLRGCMNFREQAALEQSLLDSEELHRTITEAGFEYIYVATVEEGRTHLFTSPPEVAAELVGIAPGPQQHDWRAWVDRRDHPAVERSIDELESAGTCRATFRLARRAADGRVRWVEKVERLVRGPGDGTRVFGAVRDVTREKEAAEQLRAREQELRAILESEPECVYTLDRHGRLLHLNPAGLAIIEADSLAEVRGRSIFALVAPEHRDTFRELHERVFAGESAVREFEIVGRRGTRRWIEAHAAPLRDADGSAVSHLAIGRNVTERRRLQEELIAAQRREALGVMAGGIAHDFNNMLYVILGRAELALRKAGDGSPLADDLAEIRTAARRAAGVTQQILTFSRGSLGEDVPVDLEQTLEEAVPMLRATLPATIAIRTRCDSGRHSVLGDSTQLLQIVVNLATNAAHAVREVGYGEIEFSLDGVEVAGGGPAWAPLAPGRYVRLRARDTGCGMTPETRLRALEPYFTTKPPSEGSGLGLAVVDGIVRRLGGCVRIESEPGAGTIVDVLLPASHGRAVAAAAAACDVPRGAERVLLVDDEPLVCDTQQQLLESLGYRVVAATSAIEALRLLRAEPERFDLLVADQTMPQLTGADLARAALELRPDLPVIVCTGHLDRLPAERASRAGIRACLTKPIELEQLARTVRDVLDRGPAGAADEAAVSPPAS